MKAGDIIRITRVPSDFLDESRKVFEFCFGKCFPISELMEDGRVEVFVGRLPDADEELHIIELAADEFEMAPNARPDEIIVFKDDDET